MGKITKKEIIAYVESNIAGFHKKRAESLLNLRLNDVLKRKNPYLFKAKNINSAPDLVKTILDAYLSSQEETIFGGFLEELAVFVAGRVFGGKKSSSPGIDLELEKDGTIYLVSIKSGPNWGNSGQIGKMVEDFKRAKRVLGTNTSKKNVVAVNGCSYGREGKQDKGDYLKLCGQKFWNFISGDPDFYIEIIEPLGHRAKDRNEEFSEEYGKVITRFTSQFTTDFCSKSGSILWKKLVEFNSSESKVQHILSDLISN